MVTWDGLSSGEACYVIMWSQMILDFYLLIFNSKRTKMLLFQINKMFTTQQLGTLEIQIWVILPAQIHQRWLIGFTLNMLRPILEWLLLIVTWWMESLFTLKFLTLVLVMFNKFRLTLISQLASQQKAPNTLKVLISMESLSVKYLMPLFVRRENFLFSLKE